MNDDYLFDKQGEDPEVERLEQLLGGHAHVAPLRPPPPLRSTPRRRWAFGLVGVGLAAAAAALAFVWDQPEPPDTLVGVERDETKNEPQHAAPEPCRASVAGFAFASERGRVRCGGEEAGSGTLPIGEWLETSAEATARLEVADIGDLRVHGNSRVRLLGTGSDEHRLELAQGRVTASVSAPPRLFVIDTPNASAIDLGCAYELAVDEGRTHLKVTSGAVSLEGKGTVAYVPAGTEVVALPGRGPGTPVAIDTSPALRELVARHDAGETSVLPELLALAQPRDAMTLWNLLLRTRDRARLDVHRRLEALHPPPSTLRNQDLLAGHPDALDAWRTSIEASD